ncbi:MAG: NAD-dependent epimerase/dehydratase family protein [Pseudolabrys sp.]
MSRILVTGGSGFIGSGLVKALVKAGHHVRVLDDNSRGSPRRLTDVASDIEFCAGDIRDGSVVEKAAIGMDEVHHLAFVNGTEFFYSQSDLVLDVGVRGIVNVIDACRKNDIGMLVLASSSEVYQTPPKIPTDESGPLVIPDPLNPRYSYGGGKLISELMAINFGRKYFERVLIFRPHNVYGPDMGWEHVIPQLALRLDAAAKAQSSGTLQFKIQGTGNETRSFCFIDDLVAGVMVMREKGTHLGIYHIGTTEEVTIADLARRIAALHGREIEPVAGASMAGATSRRCPDISKLAGLGYKPRVTLSDGLKPTLDWYWRNVSLAPKEG